MRAAVVLGMFLIVIALAIPTHAESIFEDDFSSDQGWISTPPTDIARDAKENNVHWHVDRSYDQRMYHPISPLTGDFNLQVDAVINDASNNCNIDIGLINDISDISKSGNFLTRIGFYGGGTPYHHWYACVLGKYEDGTTFASTAGDVTPSGDTLSGYVPIIPGNWYTYNLAKVGSTWILKVYDSNGVDVGSVSGELKNSISSFNYLYIGNGNSHDWPSANGKIDNITLKTIGDQCDDPASLRELADLSGIKIGSAAQSADLNDIKYNNTLSREFSMLVPEYEMKFDQIWPKLNEDISSNKFSDRMTDPKYNSSDALVGFAKNNSMVVRGHTLIWHNALPDWIKNKKLTRQELLGIMGKHINETIWHYEKNYKGVIIYWDVVNEAIEDSPPCALRKDSIWYQGIGDDYIDRAFEYAYNADMKDGQKDLKLFYNDYGGEEWNQKADAIYNLVKEMKDRGIHIDGVGFQMHINDAYNNPLNKNFAANIKRFTDLGLEVQITEMDVRLKTPATENDLEIQSQIYHNCMTVCLQNPRVTAFVVWGFTDKYVWNDPKQPWLEGTGQPFLFDEFYLKKQAYCGLQKALRERLTTSTSTTSSPSAGTTITSTTTTMPLQNSAAN